MAEPHIEVTADVDGIWTWRLIAAGDEQTRSSQGFGTRTAAIQHMILTRQLFTDAELPIITPPPTP